MARSTDLCTCGKTRDEHALFDSEQHRFFPHPQPNRAPRKSMIDRVEEFLNSQGEVRPSVLNEFRLNDVMFRVHEDDGKIWEVQVTLRKDPAASSEGV
jgi:hypothetical protein